MKKIFAVLATVSVLGLGVFTSCSDEEQDVNIISEVKTAYSYEYAVTGTVTVTPTGGTATTYTLDSSSYATVGWDTDTISNYQDYDVSSHFYYKASSNATSLSSGISMGGFIKLNDKYYFSSDESEVTLSADPAYAASFTLKGSKKGYWGTYEYDLAFTRK